jgi:hypothetical protein
MKASNLYYSIVIAAVLLTSCSVFESGSKRVALFDGKTLDGWTVIKCEATVDDGDILLVAGNGLVQTEKKYGDFRITIGTAASISATIPCRRISPGPTATRSTFNRAGRAT